MAISRFVLTGPVTVTADTLATVVAGEPGTGGAAGYGSSATAPSGTQGKFGLFASAATGGTWQQGMVIYASSNSADGGAYLLWQAIGAANLRAYVPGQDDVGHAALGN